MTLLEVRCCCKPQKLLGYLPQQSGTVGRFSIPADPVIVELPIATFGETVTYAGKSSPRLVKRLAYKAEGVSIQTLRQIPEFLEAR